MVRSVKCKLKMESLSVGQLSLHLEVLYFAAVCPSCPFTKPSFYHSSCFHKVVLTQSWQAFKGQISSSKYMDKNKKNKNEVTFVVAFQVGVG